MKVSIMKKIAILLVAAFALLGVNTANAQSRTSYFMEGSYFRSEFNPALVPTRGYFMIPGASGLNLNIGTNFLSFDNLIYKRGDQYVTALHESVTAEDLMKQLPKTLKVNSKAAVALFKQTDLLVLQYSEIFCSNSLVLGPVVIQPLFKASTTCVLITTSRSHQTSSAQSRPWVMVHSTLALLRLAQTSISRHTLVQHSHYLIG